MAKYNIETLSFLIGSFRDIIQSFGENNKSVEFYKRQTGQLVNIGQVGRNEADLVEELIGMQNTDAVKWDKANQKLNQFIDAINATYGLQDKFKIVVIVEQLDREGKLILSVKELVYKVYDIDTKDIINKRNGVTTLFGKIPSNPKTEKINNIVKKDKSTTDENIRLLKELLSHDTFREIQIRIRNSSAVCCGDPTYFKSMLCDILNNINLLRELALGSSNYEIGITSSAGDPCHPTTIFNVKTDLMMISRQIDWKEVFNNRDKYKKMLR